MPKMDQASLAEIQRMEAEHDTDDPLYMQLLMTEHYTHHILRRSADQWPECVMRTFAHTNHHIYALMQGPSELGASGKLEFWDRRADLSKIGVPTLTIGATHDTMDPTHMKWMAEQMPRGRHLHCPEGSHLAMYDDQQNYFDGLLAFLGELEAGNL